MKIVFSFALAALFFAVLAGCDDDSVSTDTDLSTQTTGFLVDAPVIGIDYLTETYEGITTENGEFLYANGENVTFYIGELEFPTVVAQTVVTPFTLAGTNNFADQQVINISRLLQSLDQDGNPDNGITIPENAAAFASAVDFNVPTTEFENNTAVIDLVANSGSMNTTLLPVEEVIAHLHQHFSVVGTWLFETTVTGIIFFDDGRFMWFEGDGEPPNGMEAGTYVYDLSAGTITFNVTFDNNEGGGISPDLDGIHTPVALSNSELAFILTDIDSDGPEIIAFDRQPVGGITIAGTWLNEPTSQEPFSALVLTEDNRFLLGEGAGQEPNGMEAGTYIYDSMSGTINFNVTFDSNSDGGIAPDFNGLDISATVNDSTLTLDESIILKRQ